MNDKLIDFIASLSNYTGRSIEETYSVEDRCQLIEQTLDAYEDIEIKKGTFNNLNNEQIKYLKVMFDTVNEILKENQHFN